MNAEEHLSISEIQAYSSGGFPSAQRLDIQRHLLSCPDCRNSAPAPKWNDVLNAVFVENEELNTVSLASAPFSFADRILALLTRPAFVLTGLGLLLFAGLFAALITRSLDSADQPLVAQSTSDQGTILPIIEGTRLDDRSSKKELPELSPKNRDQDSDEQKSQVSDRNRKKISRPRRTAVTPLVSDTRGSTKRCGDQLSVHGQVKVTEEGIQLIWRKVPDAIKYNIYVSDLEERLVDEFETADQASHTVKARLDPETKYHWKLLTTLKGGRSVITVMQTFSGAGVTAGNPKEQKVKTSVGDIRCLNEK